MLRQTYSLRKVQCVETRSKFVNKVVIALGLLFATVNLYYQKVNSKTLFAISPEQLAITFKGSTFTNTLYTGALYNFRLEVQGHLNRSPDLNSLDFL